MDGQPQTFLERRFHNSRILLATTLAAGAIFLTSCTSDSEGKQSQEPRPTGTSATVPEKTRLTEVEVAKIEANKRIHQAEITTALNIINYIASPLSHSSGYTAGKPSGTVADSIGNKHYNDSISPENWVPEAFVSFRGGEGRQSIVAINIVNGYENSRADDGEDARKIRQTLLLGLEQTQKLRQKIASGQSLTPMDFTGAVKDPETVFETYVDDSEGTVGPYEAEAHSGMQSTGLNTLEKHRSLNLGRINNFEKAFTSCLREVQEKLGIA